jgi:hypothetical protein
MAPELGIGDLTISLQDLQQHPIDIVQHRLSRASFGRTIAAKAGLSSNKLRDCNRLSHPWRFGVRGKRNFRGSCRRDLTAMAAGSIDSRT